MALRLVVDLQAAQSAAHAERGIARYSIELTRALLARGAPVGAVTLNPNLPMPRRLPADLRPWLTFATARTFADQQAAGRFAYHLMSPIELEPAAPLVLSRAGLERADALVTVLYDLIPLLYAERYLADARARRLYEARLELVAQSDLVLAISESTRRDAIAHLGIDPDRIVNIGGGASESFSPAGPGDDPRALLARALPAVRHDYVLTVAGYDWRKNTEALIEAFAGLSPAERGRTQLVVACAVPPDGERAWRAHGRAHGLGDDDLVLTGYIDDATLLSLYRAAALFVFPSLYEGYGLPALEAARCGAPVITSSSSSLPEILDLPSSTFPPDDVPAMRARLASGLGDPTFRAELLAAGARAAARHTWDAVAERTLAAYDALDARIAPRRRPVRRARVAVVGPLPPAESGVAIYNDRVLRAMDRTGLDLHLFADSPAGAPPAVPPIDVPCYPADALGTWLDPRDYDTVLYTVGNSSFHVRAFDLARRVPGVVWLHDAYLIGLHLEWALWQIRERGRATDVLTIFREEILAMYGGRVAPAQVLVEPLSHVAFVERDVFLNHGLLRGARAIVLNSELAHDMARLDAGPDGELPPVTVLRHAIPDRAVLPIPERGTPRPRPLVVALGIVHAIKRPEVLLRALATSDVDADLAFVGPCDDVLAAQLRALAHTLGIAERVTVTGFVDVPTYARWIGEAAIAVLLRDVSFGESSGAIHDAIAGGVPIITSIASAGDLPADLVQRVAPDCSVAHLASVMRSVLADDARRARMAAAAASYATTWSFGRVADEVGEIVRRDAWSRGR